MSDLDAVEFERLPALVQRLSVARASQKLSLECLAELTGLNEKTIRTALSGRPVRDGTILALCKALGIDTKHQERKITVASGKFGSYNLDHYSDYLGWHSAYRRSFVDPTIIISSIYNFRWFDADGESRLVFDEDHRYRKGSRLIDYSQSGDVYVHNKINIIQLLTSNKGDLRLISLAKMQDQQKSMSGIVATNAHLNVYNQPSATAIYFTKIEKDVAEDEKDALMGPIYGHDQRYQGILEALNHAERNVGLFAMSEEQAATQSRTLIDYSRNKAHMISAQSPNSIQRSVKGLGSGSGSDATAAKR